jgi:heme/copper-type cytochrome/quinol oxidase subunit 2
MPIIIIIGKNISSSSNHSTRYSRIISVTVLVAVEIVLFAVLLVVMLIRRLCEQNTRKLDCGSIGHNRLASILVIKIRFVITLHTL